MKLENCNALITGASAGIGREFARQLAGRARSMILVARRDERLIELAEQMKREHPKLVVHIRKADLAAHQDGGDHPHVQCAWHGSAGERCCTDRAYARHSGAD